MNKVNQIHVLMSAGSTQNQCLERQGCTLTIQSDGFVGKPAIESGGLKSNPLTRQRRELSCFVIGMFGVPSCDFICCFDLNNCGADFNVTADFSFKYIGQNSVLACTPHSLIEVSKAICQRKLQTIHFSQSYLNTGQLQSGYFILNFWVSQAMQIQPQV